MFRLGRKQRENDPDKRGDRLKERQTDTERHMDRQKKDPQREKNRE